MKIYKDFPQHNEDGSPNEQWLSLRAGRFSGSDFQQYLGIIKKGELSDTAESNLYKKVLESIGYSFEPIRSDAMERGTELESFAREAYVVETFNDVQEVAFVDWEKMRAGCSPDGVIFADDGSIEKIIEIKCPEIKNYVKMAMGKIPALYACQMQFNMLITGAKSCDFIVYHPDMRLIIREINADADYQAQIVTALEKLNVEYDGILEQIKGLRNG